MTLKFKISIQEKQLVRKIRKLVFTLTRKGCKNGKKSHFSLPVQGAIVVALTLKSALASHF